MQFLDVLSDISEPQETLDKEHVPVLYHEPGIHRGYRVPNKPWAYYFFSLFKVHNESMNVWTHAAAFIATFYAISYYADKFHPTDHPQGVVYLLYGISVMLMTLLSSGAHLFHSKSEFIHYIAFMADYAGVTLYSYGTGILSFHTSAQKDIYNATSPIFVPFYTILSWVAFCLCCMSRIMYDNQTQWQRKAIMVGAVATQAILSSAPTMSRVAFCAMDDTCSYFSVHHLNAMASNLICQAVLFATCFPEKHFPGKFDNFGHSHQMFHILASINAFVTYYASDVDMDSEFSSHMKPRFYEIVSWASGMVCIYVVTYTYFSWLVWIKFNRKQK